MFNIKFIVDTDEHEKLKNAVAILRETDHQLMAQYNWLVQKARGIDKQRKELADNFWVSTIKILKAEGKLPETFEHKGKIMITFGYDGSSEIFTMNRPEMITHEPD